ncbi:hypothetical protein ACFVOR_37370 [Streptomyces sp. NPDC057837]|uniref:hypothetical protein n=1 Tax=Streptomyces sp. NPDC057837 TaxID=3346260 RepID=UPI0036902618
MTTDHTHSLSVQHADALWDAVAIPGPRTPTFTEQHERVCAAVTEIIDEVTAVGEPEPEHAALRDRIAEAIRNAACNGDCGDTEEECARKRVQPCVWHHGVLAVLPPPVSRADSELASLAMNAGRALSDEKRHYEIACEENARLRAEVERLRVELRVARAGWRNSQLLTEHYRKAAERNAVALGKSWDEAAELRRMADEAQPGTEAWDVPDARPGTTDHTLTQQDGAGS